jgi:alkylation response protein AidB-like acyl-CoA dehydrogenase
VDFSWTDSQIQLRDAVVQFARKELNADMVARDRDEDFNRAGWKKCGEFGVQGLPVPERYGGRGADVLTTLYALEGLGYGCRDNGLVFALHAHMWSGAMPVVTFGTDAQKEKYLPGMCNGDLVGGNAMSEPGSGSDAFSLQATAEKRGDRYCLNGKKVFITNGPAADVLVVFATVDAAKKAYGVTAFLVERGARGLTMSEKVPKMGLRTVHMGRMTLEDCEVPAENRLGKEGAGVAVFTHAMEWERALIMSSAVGAMERQLEACVRYAKQRRQFDQPIGKFQLVSSKLVDMKLRLETARSLLYKVGWLKGRGKSVLMESAMAKLHVSECWVQSCLDAMQIHGGSGYLTETEVERDLRDALASRVYSGTSEIQRQIIAQFMGL